MDFQKKVEKKFGSYDVTQSSWAGLPPLPRPELAGGYIERAEMVTGFTTPLDMPAMIKKVIGNNSTGIREKTTVMIPCMASGEVEPGVPLKLSRHCSFLGIPMAQHFAVDSNWEFTSTSNGSRVHVEATVQFNKYLFGMEKYIESVMAEESENAIHTLFALLTEFTTPSSPTAAATSSSSMSASPSVSATTTSSSPSSASPSLFSPISAGVSSTASTALPSPHPVGASTTTQCSYPNPYPRYSPSSSPTTTARQYDSSLPLANGNANIMISESLLPWRRLVHVNSLPPAAAPRRSASIAGGAVPPTEPNFSPTATTITDNNNSSKRSTSMILNSKKESALISRAQWSLVGGLFLLPLCVVLDVFGERLASPLKMALFLLSLTLVLVVVPVTHVLAGGWKRVGVCRQCRPCAGGSRYLTLQAVAWSLYAMYALVALWALLILLSLDRSNFPTAFPRGVVSSAGAAGLISQMLVMLSMHFFAHDDHYTYTALGEKRMKTVGRRRASTAMGVDGTAVGVEGIDGSSGTGSGTGKGVANAEETVQSGFAQSQQQNQDQNQHLNLKPSRHNLAHLQDLNEGDGQGHGYGHGKGGSSWEPDTPRVSALTSRPVLEWKGVGHVGKAGLGLVVFSLSVATLSELPLVGRFIRPTGEFTHPLFAVGPVVLVGLGVAVAVPLTHALAAHRKLNGFAAWQPWVGGRRFVALQALGWTLWAVAVLLCSAELYVLLAVESYLNIKGMVVGTAVCGLLAQFFFLSSLRYFDSKIRVSLSVCMCAAQRQRISIPSVNATESKLGKPSLIPISPAFAVIPPASKPAVRFRSTVAERDGTTGKDNTAEPVMMMKCNKADRDSGVGKDHLDFSGKSSPHNNRRRSLGPISMYTNPLIWEIIAKSKRQVTLA